MVMWGGGVFLSKILQKATQRLTKVEEMAIVNDLEWPMLSYYVIYYERFRKVMQQTEKVALNM